MSLNDDKQTFGVTGIGYWYAEDKLKEAIKELKDFEIYKGLVSKVNVWDLPRDALCDYIEELIKKRIDKIFGKELVE